MTAPVRTIAAKFTAEGSETVQRAIAQVTAASTTASDRAARAAAAAATRTIETQRITAASYARSVQAAERAAYAEDAIRQRTTQRAIEASRRVAAAQEAAAQRTGAMVGSRAGMTARSVAISLDQIAVSGEATGAVMRRVASDAANVALMFSTKGPILAAIGIAGLAVFNFFARAREERQRLEDEAIAGLKRLVNAGDLEGMKQRLMDIDRGTPGEGFKDSLAARRQALENLRDLPNVFSPLLDPVQFAVAAAAKKKLIRDEELAIKALAAEYERLKNAIINFQAPNTLPTTAPITIRETAGRRFPEFNGAPGSPREKVDMSALEEVADRKLNVGVISPLGDPEKFQSDLTKSLNESLKIAQKVTNDLAAKFEEMYTPIARAISGSILAGIAGGIAAAISSGSIGEGIRALAQTVLASLGDMFAAIAVKAIAASALMVKFTTWLTLNPWAAGAAAVALLVLAKSIGGRPTGGGVGAVGSGGAGFAGAAAGGTMEMSTRLVWGNNSVATAAGMTPRQANHITIIGPDDPRAQRAINELLGNADARGLPTTGGRGRRRG